MNINDECGTTSPNVLQQLVKESRADVGIAFDGDGDRLIMVDQKANILDGDDILYIIARSQLEKLNGAVVGTVMSNLGLEHAINRLELDFFRASVGDRYVMELLLKKGLTLGGETSGHIINLDLTTTGDGIITALQVLETIVSTDRSLSELTRDIKKYPQLTRNIKFDAQVDITKNVDIDRVIKDTEDVLGDTGRIVIRPSGTESLIRVMVEGKNENQVENLVNEVVDKVSEIARSLH